MKLNRMGKPPGCKLLRIEADLEAGEGDAIIQSIQIRGDFFASPEEGLEEIEKELAGKKVKELASAFDALVRQKGIEVYGISGAGIAAVIEQAQ
ncbi:MAG: hypothetical protein LBF78_13515 [Treponema sp.]|nr:hypothetical protein [Treponema sp.]